MTAEKGIIRGRISPAHSRVVLASTPLPFPPVPTERRTIAACGCVVKEYLPI